MTAVRGHPVLLHGFTASSAAWGAPIVDGLAGAGLPPALVDLPGHGRDAGQTDPASFTLEVALGLLQAVGGWPADLVGYSMGARIALHYAAAHPRDVRRLVLESGSPGLATEAERALRRASDEALAARVLREGLAAFLDAWESQPIFESRQALSEDVVAFQRALRLRNDPGSLAAALVGLGAGALPSLWDALQDIRVPTLVLVGELDRKFVDVGERMAAAMPDATLMVVRGAGHTVHLERPDTWLEAVTSFHAD